MKFLAFVDGQEGTTGLRIHDYLAQRNDVEVLRIHPEKRKDAGERARLLNAADVAFLCLPDTAAREAVEMITNAATCVIDASTAHRIASGWAFGLPELSPRQRDAIRHSKRIANPGCHATAFILLIRPLVDAGLIPRTSGLCATSITGYSGGGKKMIDAYQSAEAAGLEAPRPYALGLNHKHIPEMTTHGGLDVAPVFMPIVGPFYKGLAVSVLIQPSQLTAGATPEAVQRAFEKRYQDERFVRVMPLRDPSTLEQHYFDVQACNDTNRTDIFVFANERAQLCLIARLDNLGKGASGAAVQSMNLHLGLEEGLGL